MYTSKNWIYNELLKWSIESHTCWQLSKLML